METKKTEFYKVTAVFTFTKREVIDALINHFDIDEEWEVMELRTGSEEEKVELVATYEKFVGSV